MSNPLSHIREKQFYDYFNVILLSNKPTLENIKYPQLYTDILSKNCNKPDINIYKNRIVNAMLYKEKYINRALKGIKHCLLTLYPENYIKLLKEQNIKKYEIDNLSDLHKCLCDYNLEFKKALIKQLNCNIIVYSKILNSLKEKEYGYFESITSEYKIDLSDIVEICSFHESFILTEIDNSSTLKKIYNDKVINNTIRKPIDFLGDYGELNEKIPKNISISSYKDIFKEYSSEKEYNLDELITNGEIFIEETEQFIIFIFYLFNYIGEKEANFIINNLSDSEFEYYNNLINYYKNIFIDKTKTTTNNDEKIISTEFTLPSDLFSDSKYKKGCKEKEFYSITINLEIGKSPEKLAKLVNDLANQGYIDNDLETKKLFVYRFTGRLRPDKLRKIKWHSKGKSKRGCELLYIIQIITNTDRKYEKAKEYFEGPEWGINPNQSGKDATKGFKSYLHDLFPNDFPAYVPKGKK